MARENDLMQDNFSKNSASEKPEALFLGNTT